MKNIFLLFPENDFFQYFREKSIYFDVYLYFLAFPLSNT